MARLPMVPETAVPAAMHRVVKGETELTTTLQALFAVPEVASRLVDLDDLASPQAGLEPWVRLSVALTVFHEGEA